MLIKKKKFMGTRLFLIHCEVLCDIHFVGCVFLWAIYYPVFSGTINASNEAKEYPYLQSLQLSIFIKTSNWQDVHLIVGQVPITE